MKTYKKELVLKAISENLSLFNSKYNKLFLCPTCLSTIKLSNIEKISKAHIIPYSSGGKLFTWLCSECNSKFGRNQDKWFGEYINIKKTNKILSEKTTKQGLYIDDTKIYGKVTHDKDGINLNIKKNKKSDEIINEIETGNIPSFELKVKMPILSKEDQIELGYITAAYLYCFNLFGYSWVLQNHLQNIRDAITQNNIKMLNNIHVSKIDSENEYPDLIFGFAKYNKKYIPIVKVIDRVIFFPTSINEGIPNEIKNFDGKFELNIKFALNLLDQNYTIPFIMTIDDQVILYPNNKECNIIPNSLLIIDSKTFQHQLLHKVNKNFNELKKTNHNLHKIQIPITNKLDMDREIKKENT